MREALRCSDNVHKEQLIFLDPSLHQSGKYTIVVRGDLSWFKDVHNVEWTLLIWTKNML